MEKNTGIFLIVAALVIGLWIGNMSGGNNYRRDKMMNQRPAGMHMMPNGEMMHNGASMSMGDMMMDMNAALKGKTGDAFDQAFLTEMIVHHQGAVEMAQLALTNAKHQEIKDLAKAIIAAQNKEIADMKAWEKNWYNK